jgi:hypothetical protein
MRGYITEANFDECEEAFPGIVEFYSRLAVKPGTFLELVHAFMSRVSACAGDEPPAAAAA